MSIEEQQKTLQQTMTDILMRIGWINDKGKIKNSISFRKKNIKIENIKISTTHQKEHPDQAIINMSFDVHYLTEQEEAINHKDTFWMIGTNDKYDINRLYKGLDSMMTRIKNQMVFTTKIDKNLYNFWNLNEKGWKILQSIPSTASKHQ